MILRRLFVLIVLSLVGWCAQAQSGLIATRGIYVDGTLDLGIDEVVGKEFSPFNGLLKRSLSPRVRWIHLTIDRSRSAEQVATLVVGPHYLAEIFLYERQQGQWVRRVVGDRYPSPQLNCPVGQYCFAVTLDTLDSPDLYLRIQTTNGYYVTTQLLDRASILHEIREKALSAGLECGVLLALIVLSLLLVLTGSGKIAIYFFLTQITSLLLTVIVLGVPAEYLSPEYAWVDNFLFNLSYVLRCFFSIQLAMAFLQNLSTPIWYDQLTRALSAIFLLEIVWLIFMPVSLYALAFNFAFIVFWPLVWFVALFQARIQPLIHRYLMLSVVILMTGMMWADMIPALSFSYSDRMLVPGNFGGLMVSILMSLLVTSEVRVRSQAQKNLIAELARTQSVNLLESQQIKERGMMIDMLTHELKNPLAAMRMAAGSLKTSLIKLPVSATQDANDRIGTMIDAIEGMNTVIERCVQVDSLDQEKIVVMIEEVDIEDVLHDALRASRNPGRIRIHVDSPPLVIKTDLGLLSIVVTNLIDNSLKYSPHDSLVEVSARMDASGFKLVVENAVGEAGSPEPEKVFFRYYRGEHAHAWPGTGLGLYLVKSICDILHGTVECRTIGKKVNFSVTLQS